MQMEHAEDTPEMAEDSTVPQLQMTEYQSKVDRMSDPALDSEYVLVKDADGTVRHSKIVYFEVDGKVVPAIIEELNVEPATLDELTGIQPMASGVNAEDQLSDPDYPPQMDTNSLPFTGKVQ
jgi:hypothetical protein